MPRIANLSILPVVALVAACANSGSNYEPIIDGTKGPNYPTDLAQCQQLSTQPQAVDGSTAADVATGAGVAAASSAIFNGTGSGNNIGEAAAVGAIVGLTGNQVAKSNERENIIKSCMRGRGYRVVG